jgi:hypothetical protein
VLLGKVIYHLNDDPMVEIVQQGETLQDFINIGSAIFRKEMMLRVKNNKFIYLIETLIGVALCCLKFWLGIVFFSFYLALIVAYYFVQRSEYKRLALRVISSNYDGIKISYDDNGIILKTHSAKQGEKIKWDNILFAFDNKKDNSIALYLKPPGLYYLFFGNRMSEDQYHTFLEKVIETVPRVY